MLVITSKAKLSQNLILKKYKTIYVVYPTIALFVVRSFVKNVKSLSENKKNA